MNEIKRSLHLWFGLRERVGRGAYIWSGLGLMAFKFAVDTAVVYWVTGAAIDPLVYLSPVLAHRQSLAAGEPLGDALLLWMAAWALPFAWVGLSMSLRRAVDAGLPGLVGLLFFMPGLNFMLMAALCVLPSKPTSTWQATHEAPVGLHRVKTAMLGTGIGLGIGVAMTLLSTLVLGEYGSVLFVITPVMMGAAGSFMHNRTRPRTLASSLLVGSLSVLLVGGVLLLTAAEGVLCLVMALPLGVAMAWFGALAGRALALRSGATIRQVSVAVLALPMLGFVEPTARVTRLFVAHSQIEIDAPPEAVWPNVIGFSELPEPGRWFFELGVAYPQRARIEGAGVGAVRSCEFSTGPFVEPITAWVPPHRLAFDVASQPPPMTELSPYRELHPPHLDRYLRSRKGEFRLVALAGGRTRLEGRTWYELDIFPASYWSIFSQVLIGAIHDRVLTHIKVLTESAAAPTRPSH